MLPLGAISIVKLQKGIQSSSPSMAAFEPSQSPRECSVAWDRSTQLSRLHSQHLYFTETYDKTCCYRHSEAPRLHRTIDVPPSYQSEISETLHRDTGDTRRAGRPEKETELPLRAEVGRPFFSTSRSYLICERYTKGGVLID